MNAPLFRQEVIEARRHRLVGAVVAATPPRSGLYAALLLAVTAAIGAILLFGQHAARSEVRGIVSYDSGIARIQPNAPGEISEIHAREGQRVAAGTPLVTLALAQGRGGLAPQLADLARQDSELERQQQLASALRETEAASLARQRINLSAAIGSLERQRALAAGQVRLAEADTRRAAALAAEGAGTQRQVEESRSGLLARRAELESLNERIIAQRDQLRAVEAQLAQGAIEAERSRSELAAQRATLAEQRSGLSRQDRLVLTAPVAGIVEQIGGQLGQRASPDAAIVTLVPANSRIEVWLYAPSRAIGFVRPGQEVRLLFDAFPHQTYGSGRGTVLAISRVPVDPAAIDRTLGIDEPAFRIRVAIVAAPAAAQSEGRLRAGMTLTANLVLERRPLWRVLFSPFASALR
ncbi:MAG TPA: HlyD family efflux transporter periplasmic adaptor subunit [Allosphingosinicella sp.]